MAEPRSQCAIDERYHGRTARTFMVGATIHPGDDPLAVHANALSVADTIWGFAAGTYPTDHPSLPQAAADPDRTREPT